MLDWLFARFLEHTTGKEATSLLQFVDWQWKGIDSLDPEKNENAIALQLKNMTKTYKDILGNDWQEKLR